MPDNNEIDIEKELASKIKAEKSRFKPNGDKPDFKPLVWPDVSVSRFLKEKPPDQEFLFDGLILKGLVYGWFATGGTGKSFLLLQLCVCLATGKTFGPFNPSRKFKVLYIGAEDPESELWRRVHLIASNTNLLRSEDLGNNLAVYSAVGKIGPLLQLDGKNNPTTTLQYKWLKDSIKSLDGLEILILDPMSRFYGLNENDNAHGTAWIQALEKLIQEHNISIWFAHHEPKAASQNKNLRDSTGRGAGSIRDGCRGSISLREMTETDGQKFDVDPRNHIELDISKANYTAKLHSSISFVDRDGVSWIFSANFWEWVERLP